jgi:hypothetical protein
LGERPRRTGAETEIFFWSRGVVTTRSTVYSYLLVLHLLCGKSACFHAVLHRTACRACCFEWEQGRCRNFSRVVPSYVGRATAATEQLDAACGTACSGGRLGKSSRDCPGQETLHFLHVHIHVAIHTACDKVPALIFQQKNTNHKTIWALVFQTRNYFNASSSIFCKINQFPKSV